ncbi:MAG: ABC transporter ATP-binding protein [Myxococcota bacterium]|nr:ABC transporter ATP-binding protein [Myxococcota bacterium]
MSEQGSNGVSVVIRDLCRRFDKNGNVVEVLQGVDLEIGPGERVAILGPSGSGKSTFLHTLGTLERPSEGQILLDGEDLGAMSAARVDALRNRKIGFVFQFHHLLPELNALDNVAMPMLVGGMRRNEAREQAATALVDVGLEHRLNHLPGELSGGEQQRVAIARALVGKPGLLLADEPTGNLDPKTADGVLELFLRLHEEVGSTLVVVTHSRELASRFPRRLYVVDGRLEEAS